MKNLMKSKKADRTQILKIGSGGYFGGTMSGNDPVTVSRANALHMTPESAIQHRHLLTSWGLEAEIEAAK
jgi:hypothetical protein